MDGHVLSQIGLHAAGPDDPCGEGLHLHLSPMVLEDDGHLDFGVLGVFLDMASSQVGVRRPFLHADISVHRIARPRGERLHVDVRALRTGKRTATVQIEAFDELGTRVADSSQQMVFFGPPPGSDDASNDQVTKISEEMREKFRLRLDGICTLEGRLHDIIGIAESPATIDGDGPCWTMPLGPASRNGFGGLHGGVAFDLVTEAAVGGASAELGPVEAHGALLRYLSPAEVGPFRAVPTVMAQDDGSVFVRVAVFDDGNKKGDEAPLCILGEVHLARRT